MAAFENQLPFYDRRRPLGQSPGLVAEHLGTPVKAPYLIPLVSDLAARAAAGADKLPLPAPEDREGYYGDRHFEYWLSGYFDANSLIQAAGALRPEPGKRLRHLDFGGCTGRVARHVARTPGYESWICDINAVYIDWLEAYAMGSGMRFFQNRPYPTLPFEPGSFDVVSAFSVFTHISEGELHWLLELKRIVRPGGLLYITVLDDASWAFTRAHRWLVPGLGRGPDEERLKVDIEQPAIPENRYVLRYSTADAYNCNVFYRRSYLEAAWLPHFRSGNFVDGGHFYQSVLLLTT